MTDRVGREVPELARRLINWQPSRRSPTSAAYRASAPLAAALGPFTRRLWLRRVLAGLRVALLVGLSGAAPLALGGRLLDWTSWTDAIVLWALVVLGSVVVVALFGRPDAWTAARAADDLGLAERTTSALYADASKHPVAPILVGQAIAALESAPVALPLLPERGRWRWVLAATLLAAAAVLVPLPVSSDRVQRAAEARTIAEARKSVEDLSSAVESPEPEPLARATAEELRALDERLEQARSVAEAAREIEASQARLAGLSSAQDVSLARATERLAQTWAGRSDLGDLARSLGAGDPREVERAVAALAERAERMTPQEQRDLNLALQSGANATREAPDLAAALRQAAAASAGEQGASGEGSAGQALQGLAAALTAGAGRAGSVRGLDAAVASLGQTRAGVGVAGSAAAASSGAASGQAMAGTGSPGSGGNASSGSGSGDDGSGSGSGSGDGSGSGNGQGNASGAGSSGSGTGAGAGRGGGPAPGNPGASGAGLTSARGTGSPSRTGATTYDPVYAPSLIGGEDGPESRLSGDPRGASGESVESPEGPVTLGQVRPYDEIYARYEAAARESLSRQSLPPSLQGLVQRYFTALAPE